MGSATLKNLGGGVQVNCNYKVAVTEMYSMYTRCVNRAGPNAGLAGLGPIVLTGPARFRPGQTIS